MRKTMNKNEKKKNMKNTYNNTKQYMNTKMM